MYEKSRHPNLDMYALIFYFYFFQMKEHEKALRIFVHNIGDFAEAEQYCNQITLDQPRREKETLLLLFLTVLLDTAATKRYVRLLYNVWFLPKTDLKHYQTTYVFVKSLNPIIPGLLEVL